MECLSPFIDAELVKPAAVLFFRSWLNQRLLVAFGDTATLIDNDQIGRCVLDAVNTVDDTFGLIGREAMAAVVHHADLLHVTISLMRLWGGKFAQSKIHRATNVSLTVSLARHRAASSILALGRARLRYNLCRLLNPWGDFMPDGADVTQCLLDWRAGNRAALEKLIPMVEHTLHNIAQRQMRGEHAGHTLQATALVNEAYICLIDASVSWENRAHFLAVVARTMRRVLVDHAKAKGRAKRGAGDLKVTLYEAQLASPGAEPDVLDLDEALSRLVAFDERKASVIELSFFGGMTYDEIAEALDISSATVDRDLRLGKAWLYREIAGDAADKS